MFIPVGDEVGTRSLPVMATGLIAVTVLIWVHTGTMAKQAEDAVRAQRVAEGDVLETDFFGRPTYATRELVIKRLAQGKHWDRFVREWGLVPSSAAHGEFHSFISYIFVHANLWHLLANVIILWMFARTLEMAVGPALLLLFYLFWGIFGAGMQALVSPHSAIPYLGADAAVAGVMGAYLFSFGVRARINVVCWIWFGVPVQVFSIPATAFLSLWAFAQVWVWALAGKAGVSNLAWVADLAGFSIGMLTLAVFKTELNARLQAAKAALEQKLAPIPVVQQSTVEMVAPVPPETVPVLNVVTAPAVDLPPATKCRQCGQTLTADNRVMEDLYRCPRCKMLADTSPQAVAQLRRR